jgi:proline iminopeptidase
MQGVLMFHLKHLRCLIILLWLGFGLSAQPSLQRLWSRHDELALKCDPKPLTIDPSCAFAFKGQHGQVVRGWDVGDPKAPVVLWWQGGPGGAAAPEYDAQYLGDPKAYRHVEIDQPGTGKSAWLEGWKPEDTIEDAVTFLRMREVKGPVIVCGWSWGSTMALLFAQRHPELVRGVVVGGVWANSPAEVSYYLDATGSRAWAPGLSEAFVAFSTGKGTACDLHAALREGRGGLALAEAYARAEGLQCTQGVIPRKTLLEPVPNTPGKPVDMDQEADDTVRFAYIESEMMCRGQRGEWRLNLQFPKQLATVPLIVMQGRYDQVCDPEVAREVHRAWPGKRKLLVPFNGGHWMFSGPGPKDRLKAGLILTPEQETQLQRANSLTFGSGFLIGAAIESLVHPPGGP